MQIYDVTVEGELFILNTAQCFLFFVFFKGQTAFFPVGWDHKSLVVFLDKLLLGPNQIKVLVAGGFLSHIPGNITKVVQPQTS